MIELFQRSETDKEMVELTTMARTLAPFKAIIVADKGSEGDAQARKKLMANMELAFVYWHSKFDSQYNQYKGEDKIRKIKKAVGLPEKWQPSELVKEACAFFEENQRTPSMRHLDSIESAINKLSDYLKNTDPDERNPGPGPKTGELVHDLNKFKALAKEMPDILKAYQDTKELVRKEIIEMEEGNRGNRKTNLFTE